MSLQRKYFQAVLKDEIKALKEQFVESKLLFWAFLVSVAAVITYLDPFPDRHIYFASSFPGSAWHNFAVEGADYLKDLKFETEIITTDGALENVERIESPSDKANTGLSFGLVLNDEQRSKVWSLGSIAYHPFWIYYHKDKVHNPSNLRDLAKYKVGLGPSRSGSFLISRILFNQYGISIDNNPHFISDGFMANEARFLKGELDVYIVATAAGDPQIKRLLTQQDITLFDFNDAHGFDKKFDSLFSLNLSRGSIQTYPAIPSQDITLLGTTTSLVVKQDLHPDAQLALLVAYKNILRDSNDLFFAKRNEFPSYMDPLIPISPVAAKFYDYGPPNTLRYLPFWVAGFVDRAGVFFVTLLAIFYPLSKLRIQLRLMRFTVKMQPFYEELLKIQNELVDSTLTKEEVRAILVRLDRIDRTAIRSGVPIGKETDYFEFLSTINTVRESIMSRLN